MRGLLADYVLTMDPANPVLRDCLVLFDEKIVAITNDKDEIAEHKRKTKIEDLGRHSVLLPGLINAHTHLEFSSNRTELEYGSFIGWLSSVMQKRETLINMCDEECHLSALESMLISGTTTVGAISSYGFDLNAALKSKQRIVYCNELIGPNPATLDLLYSDFINRYENSANYNSPFFKAAVAIHSPYSVHPVLLKKVLEFARKRGLFITTHFMESRSERKWLDSGTGSFKPFFKQYLKIEKPITTPDEFLSSFEGTNPLFVHAVHSSIDELDKIKKLGGSIAHCPVSNRLLGVGLLDLEVLKNREIDYLVATDGMSSNRSLNLFDELRSALLMHEGLDLTLLARDLLLSVTNKAAKVLGFDNGVIKSGKLADLISFNLPSEVENMDQIYLQIILHAPAKMKRIYINGDEIDAIL